MIAASALSVEIDDVERFVLETWLLVMPAAAATRALSTDIDDVDRFVLLV